MAYELGGQKRRPWWELLLASFGGGGGSVGFGTSAATKGESAWWGSPGEGTPAQEARRRILSAEKANEVEWQEKQDYQAAKDAEIRRSRRPTLTPQEELARARSVGVAGPRTGSPVAAEVVPPVAVPSAVGDSVPGVTEAGRAVGRWSAPAAKVGGKTMGMFTVGGVTYGEESLGLPPEERVALTPEEIARRREAYKPARSKYAAKRRETLLTGEPERKRGSAVLGGFFRGV